uniref:Solute-binding protein family 3/N-terminal domain-containing protein n=1 Tax=Mucochytrium quahogii TaxID=96639 RepID=A0A7S2SKR6_9STRA|mmetsp:Transcript_12940/g.20941  ORF Transcript_12940/g.20941 Transcript_12940/m.20941 type:complete len:281 (+) Transcript_12940:215-1057(+)
MASALRFVVKTYVLVASVATCYGHCGTNPANELRVCTTGDYPPLTYYNPKTVEWKGDAIIVATHFAKFINKSLTFVQVTWPTLSTTLAAGKCDIAMGGISQTVDRANQFSLTEANRSNSKQPIFAKQDAKYFNGFSDIDTKEVTVIENKGGTNEPFAKKVIKNAKIVIVETNQEAYACLNANARSTNRTKLVMFTDSIEIDFRSSIKGSLLSGKGNRFTDIPQDPRVGKVYMAQNNNRGSSLVKQFNDFYNTHQRNFDDWYQEALKTEYPEEKVKCPLDF